MLCALLAIEPEKVFAIPDPQLPDNEYKLMATLSDLADRELVATIGWAKQVPGKWYYSSLREFKSCSSLVAIRGLFCSGYFNYKIFTFVMPCLNF